MYLGISSRYWADDFSENVSFGCIYMVGSKENGKIIGGIDLLLPTHKEMAASLHSTLSP